MALGAGFAHECLKRLLMVGMSQSTLCAVNRLETTPHCLHPRAPQPCLSPETGTRPSSETGEARCGAARLKAHLRLHLRLRPRSPGCPPAAWGRALVTCRSGVPAPPALPAGPDAVHGLGPSVHREAGPATGSGWEGHAPLSRSPCVQPGGAAPDWSRGAGAGGLAPQRVRGVAGDAAELWVRSEARGRQMGLELGSRKDRTGARVARPATSRGIRSGGLFTGADQIPHTGQWAARRSAHPPSPRLPRIPAAGRNHAPYKRWPKTVTTLSALA